MTGSSENRQDGETGHDLVGKEHLSPLRGEVTPVGAVVGESSVPVVVPEVVVRRAFSLSFLFWSIVAVGAVAYVAFAGVAPALITTYANTRLASKIRDAEAAILGGKWEVAHFYIRQAEAIEGATENLGALERVRAQVNRHNAEQYVWRPAPVRNEQESDSASSDSASDYLGSEPALKILVPDGNEPPQMPSDSPQGESK